MPQQLLFELSQKLLSPHCLILFFFTLTVPSTRCPCGLKNGNRIVNGNTSSKNEWPWQVLAG